MPSTQPPPADTPIRFRVSYADVSALLCRFEASEQEFGIISGASNGWPFDASTLERFAYWILTNNRLTPRA